MTFDCSGNHDTAPSASPQGPLSRVHSVESVNLDTHLADIMSSDELDKLSSCLSEVSNDSGNVVQTSVVYDIIQAQLALWTCVCSLLYSYAWRQHRKKFLLSIFFVVPAVFFVCCGISALLTTIVVASRLFSTPLAYKSFLKFPEEKYDENGGYRQRSYSGTSTASYMSDDYLPKPLCRRHSSSHTSLCSGPTSGKRKLSYCYSHMNANGSDDED